jgi:hypothetical protein
MDPLINFKKKKKDMLIWPISVLVSTSLLNLFARPYVSGFEKRGHFEQNNFFEFLLSF